ncbi:MAG: SMP-30/gluconolactonase/LRE family protein [Planctomycetes bacterium]|nr:SMP-30/gluconolactonase/LRE family protein [Planctomycetota bacterium]
MRRFWLYLITFAAIVALPSSTAHSQSKSSKPGWIFATATHVPSEFTNQESGYFSIIEGLNGNLYIGTAKYGVNSYLMEFNPIKMVMKMVVDVHRVIGIILRGFGAQAKIHTRNNVGASGKIYFGTKQGYPEKGEKRTDYPGGYVMTYDPKTKQTEHFPIAIKHQGIISVTPDESRGVAYISTCDDGRPIEKSHFMILDLKKKTYRDLGDSGHSYAFIVLDNKGRAYHPFRGGLIARYDPETDKLEKLPVTIDGDKPPKDITKDGAILNWEASPDGKTLYAIEMSTNQLFAFDMTASGSTIPGKRLGALLPGAKATDVRGMAVNPKGVLYAHVTSGGPYFNLVSYTPGSKGVRDHGKVAVANPNYTPFVDAKGKPLPWHHAVHRDKDGTLAPTTPLGLAAARDGSVYVLTLAPLTVLRIPAETLK